MCILIYIYDESKEKLCLMNFRGIPEDVAKEIEWLKLGEAVCGCVGRDQQRIIEVNIDTSVDERVQLVKGFRIKAYACHPLMSYGKMIGKLSFGSSKRSFDKGANRQNQKSVEIEPTFIGQRGRSIKYS